MQQSHIQPIQHYNLLLARLRPWGLYQMRLVILMALYWLLSGMNQGVFQLTLADTFSSFSFIVQQGIQIAVILLSVFLSLRLPRNKINTALNTILLIGSFLVALGSHFESDTAALLGQFFVSMLHYAVALNILMITIQFFNPKNYSIILITVLVAQTVGQLISVQISAIDISKEEWALVVLIPWALFYLLSSLAVPESPRYWISQDIIQAEQQLHTISQTNNVKYEHVQQLLQRQFFWHQVTLTKYSFLTLFTYKSINFNTYIFCVQAFLLGIICRCPDFIQHLRENTSFVVNDDLSITWSASFQLFALIPAYLASAILKRKNLILSVNLALLILIALLVLFELGHFEQTNLVLLVMVIFGLSSFFSIVLFYYIFLSAIEFYPHTIRTMAVGVIFSFYLLGKLAFSMHIEWIEKDLNRNEGMMELVLSCSLMLLLHSWLMQQTFESGGRYDLPELQKRQFDQY